MLSLRVFLDAHPGVLVWGTLWLLITVVLLARRVRRAHPAPWRPDGRWIAVGALGAALVVSLAPPPAGLVPGLAPVCDMGRGHLLWPWAWTEQDARLPGIWLMVLVGLALAGRWRWWPVAAGLPVVVEAVQYLVPSLARVCSLPDLLHAWSGLGLGIAAGLLLGVLARRWVRSRVVERLPWSRRRGALVLAALALVGIVVAVGVLVRVPRAVNVTDPRTEVELLTGPVAGTDDAATERWLEQGRVPGEGTAYEELGRSALADLHSLVTDRGEDGTDVLPAAGPARNWDYFWPRDGAFVIAALAGTGHHDEAVRLLSELDRLYLDPMYGFDARYHRDGGPVVLDPRRAQVDGCGWILWAVHETGRARGDVLADGRIGHLRDACTDQVLRATQGGTTLPAPSQDYWERTTWHRFLGAGAPLVAGLRVAGQDYAALGRPGRAGQVGVAAEALRGQVDRWFGPDFERAGDHGGHDAAVAMLMPPLDPEPLPGVRAAWEAYQTDALREGGGLAPGVEWRDDGISWTPEVALVAWTAAADGDRETAEHWLTWLAGHRTEDGALPEKVAWDGSPGGPAPLGWTAALVVLTLLELEEAG